MLRSTYLYCILFFLILLTGCNQESHSEEGAIKEAVLKVLNDQVQAWNEFNIESFMDGYLNSDSLRFASGGAVYYGWQTTLERYKRAYPDPSAMGKLMFSRISINILSTDAAIVFGRYTLKRESDTPTGLFTLLFQKTEAGWKIAHDHTSTARE